MNLICVYVFIILITAEGGDTESEVVLTELEEKFENREELLYNSNNTKARVMLTSTKTSFSLPRKRKNV